MSHHRIVFKKHLRLLDEKIGMLVNKLQEIEYCMSEAQKMIWEINQFRGCVLDPDNEYGPYDEIENSSWNAIIVRRAIPFTKENSHE